MKSRRLAPLGLMAIGILALYGCDAGGFKRGGTQTTGPGDKIVSPILISLSPGDENLCVGQEITLLGLNFSSVLEENEVSFKYSDAAIPGLPVRVEFPDDGNRDNGLESRLRVLVPTGVGTGTLDLQVRGVSAGSVSYTACPQIMTYAIGAQGVDPTLLHSRLLGFHQNFPPTQVTLFGLNFEEVDQVLVSDNQGGNPVKVPQNQILNRPLGNAPSNNLQQIGFDLKGVNLAVAGQRDNILVQVATPNFQSNQVQVPVADEQEASTKPKTGAIINGVIVPPGVRTGPVKVRYCMYDYPVVDQAFTMEVSWSTSATGPWKLARPDLRDPEHEDSKSKDPDKLNMEDPKNYPALHVLPGVLPLLPAADPTSANRVGPTNLFFAGGGLRTFSWDAQNDPEFLKVKAGQGQVGGSIPRNFTIYFLIHPKPEVYGGTDKPSDVGHFFISPPLAYYDLEDRGSTSFAENRAGTFNEDFSTNSRADYSLDTTTKKPLTTASWGPPNSPKKLEGTFPIGVPSQFGKGTADLAMIRRYTPDTQPPDFVREYYEINTDILQINHVTVAGVAPDILEIKDLGFPTVDFPNPGDVYNEFHVRTLFVGEGIDVVLEGSRPVIFRVSGTDLEDTDPTVIIAGTLHANGDPGGTDSTGQPAPGLGGASRCGGGKGGNGAVVILAQNPLIPGTVESVRPSQDGANNGGGGGGTAAAIDNLAQSLSKFRGAPGGGGGARLAGIAGDPGNPSAPTYFNVPKGGRGGPMRGNQHCVPLVGGSGGGGGGGTVYRPNQANPPYTAYNGGGGGGGGGAIQITAHGTMVFYDHTDGTANIQAIGGKGENATGQASSPDSGAGGGGSGGSILLQASGSIEVSGSSLDVRGGDNGTMGSLQLALGEGEGSSGWIRVEPRFGGGPAFTKSLAFETKLAKELTASVAANATVTVDDTTGLPPSGVVLVGDEAISYRVIVGKELREITRGLNGTTIAVHPIGTPVILEATVFPPSSLDVEEDPIDATKKYQFFENPDSLPASVGADGNLQVFFIETKDPETNRILVDPVTGVPISLWEMNTDLGTITNPDGVTVLRALAADEGNPGLFSFNTLKINTDVILRVSGSRPLRIIANDFDIAGTLDLSGFEGGALRFDENRVQSPDPGLGGSGGPGGGVGGGGGTIEFSDKDLENKDPSNTIPISGEWGGLPENFPPEFDMTEEITSGGPGPDEWTALMTTRATAGEPLRDQSCGTEADPCTAGGGGGGGNLDAGSSGKKRPEKPTNSFFGLGGSTMGIRNFRLDGDLFLLGGQGGAGGGGSAFISTEYASKLAGSAIFQGAARFAPGTGGGGGGGVLNLVAVGSFTLRGTGSILARGGNAYQSIDLAGNGGAGSGGSVLIQLGNAFNVESGGKIDVSGGIANQAPPIPADGTIPFYEGNIRLVGKDIREFGGKGGNGAIGRVRIEVLPGSNLRKAGFNESLSSSIVLVDTTLSSAYSRPIPLGVGPGLKALSHLIFPDKRDFTIVNFPDNTNAFLLWDGAPSSLERYGVPGTMAGSIEDIRELQSFEYVRFAIYLISSNAEGETPSVTDVEVPYELGNPSASE